VNEIKEIVSSSMKESTYESEDPLYYFDDWIEYKIIQTKQNKIFYI
jgi:hypothetical protein